MSWLEFISKAVSSLAWPVISLLIVLLLKPHLSEVIDALRKIKWKGVEAEFGRELIRARAIVDLKNESETKPSGDNADYLFKNRKSFLELADLSPRSVVLEAWREVENACLKTLEMAGTKAARTTPSVAIVRLLRESKLIEDSNYEMLMILRDLRNRAVHQTEFSISKDEAIEYAILASRLTVSIYNEIKKGPAQ